MLKGLFIHRSVRVRQKLSQKKSNYNEYQKFGALPQYEAELLVVRGVFLQPLICEAEKGIAE